LIGAGTALLYFVLGKALRGWPNFALVLVVATAVAAWMGKANPSIAVETFGAVSIGSLLPDLGVFGDSSIFDHIAQLSGLAFGLAFLASLENSVMSKSLASRTGDRPDMNQDMLGVGLANLGSSILSGMVASGSLTRSALNYSSGAVTRMSSMFSAVFCAVGLFLLAPMIQYVPKCALAALVISVALTLINAHQLRICWRATRSDAATLPP
jgi:SulP family sulfate permease